jgi:hypothetical protein
VAKKIKQSHIAVRFCIDSKAGIRVYPRPITATDQVSEGRGYASS